MDYIQPGIRVAAGSGKISRVGRSGPSKGLQTPPWKPNGDLSNCDNIITPDCVKALYKIPEPATSANPNNSLGIFEDGDYYAQKDLNLFFKNFSLGIPQGTHPKPAFIDGGEAPVPTADAGGESDLDFQLAYPIIYPQTITLYQTDDSYYAQNDSVHVGLFNTFLDALDGVGEQSI